MHCVRRWTGPAWRVLAAVCALLATGLAGCGWFNTEGYAAYGPPMVPAYGVQMVPLEIKFYTYTPSSPVHVGDTLTFTAQLEPAQYLQANVAAGNTVEPFHEWLHVQLHDDGVAPDTVAGDNVFTGSGRWLAEYGTGEMKAHLGVTGFKPEGAAAGHTELPLQVLP